MSVEGYNKDISIPAQFPEIDPIGILSQGDVGDDIKSKKEKTGTQEERDPTQQTKTTSRIRVKRDLKMTGEPAAQVPGVGTAVNTRGFLFLDPLSNARREFPGAWPRFSPGLVYLSVLMKCLFSTPLHAHKSILLGPTSDSRSKAMAGFKSKVSSSHGAIKPRPQLLSPCT